MKIVLATGNAGKLNEMRSLLAPLSAEIVSQGELGVSDADETGLTFIENALIKARHACHVTGLPAIADDSGIEVAALGGAPGIYSARYAGEPSNSERNIDKLLEALGDTPDDQRQASFRCVVVYLRHANDPVPLISEGCWHGQITHARSGAGGFGYDPVFFDPSQGCTAAEMDKADKDRLSHRGQALQHFLAQYRQAAVR